jgi:aarF domain-containing kinase
MQRLVRIHCRGAASSRLQPIKNVYRPFSFFSPVRQPTGSHSTSQNRSTDHNRNWSSSHRSFRQIPQPPLLIAISAATSIPIVQRKVEEEEDDDLELTLEQSLLDTSEEERRAQAYGISKDWSIFYRLFRYVKITFIRYISEPIATGLRFIQLVFIFIPVLATIPVIFVGPRIADCDNERSGTLWWYRFLVRQMERAGATFIKVLLFSSVG